MFKTVMGNTQEALILSHLKKAGSITGVEAMAIFKVRSLPRRICTLKQQGWVIDSVRMTDTCGQRYVRYKFCKNQPNLREQQRQGSLF